MEPPERGAAAAGGRGAPDDLERRVIDVLRAVRDPEIPIGIYDLGLIYALRVTPRGVVEIEMTLTAPGCPVAGMLVGEVEERVAALAGVAGVRVDLTWDPPWTRARMRPEARLALGLD